MNWSCGKWKCFFEYSLSKVSDSNNIGWYILSNPKAVTNKAHAYYKDLISVFNKVGANVNTCTCFSCVYETCNLPLWRNTIITDNANKNLASRILKPRGIIHLGQIIENDKIVPFHKLADRIARSE